jgi:hypothetical protein
MGAAGRKIATNCCKNPQKQINFKQLGKFFKKTTLFDKKLSLTP